MRVTDALEGRHVYLAASIEEIPVIPPDLLGREGCAVPLEAVRLLKEDVADEVAIVGRVFGPWTLGYHAYGVEEFLIVGPECAAPLDAPCENMRLLADEVKRLGA